ncbi:MAG TPA: hypothetical protein VFT43_13985 [Candidatus Polarisedimenticolia bacterium]|nr:hypothetical protein [Candidatus Polarisedimenticolia bacterium]
MNILRSSAGLWIPVIFGALIFIGIARPSLAYDQYSDGTASVNCAVCHETTSAGGFQSRGPLHDAHTNSATNTCTACHMKQGDVPFTWQSGDAVLNKGCSGCHGSPRPDGTVDGAGLRLHHANKGVTVCADCHSDAAPPAESVNPVYYGKTGVIQTSSCNVDTLEDFWTVGTGPGKDGKGLDNDGDLLVDAADGDCAVVTCKDLDGDGYGNPGDPSCPKGSATDCDDAHADTYPGAVENYDQRDNNCNTEIDEIEKDGFFTPTDRTLYSWQAQPPATQLYDVLRSDGAQFPTTSANTVCLVVATPLTSQADGVNPTVGKAFYYLVRNTLVVDYGKRTNGTLRLYTTCP